MMGKTKRGQIWREAPFVTGITITLLVFGLAVWSLSVGEVCGLFGKCVSKWAALLASPPNEIGDALAGFAGTIAFVWLIVTVWLQATELREQRKVMSLQGDEMREQSKATQEMAKLMASQSALSTLEIENLSASRLEAEWKQKIVNLVNGSVNAVKIILDGLNLEITDMPNATYLDLEAAIADLPALANAMKFLEDHVNGRTLQRNELNIYLAYLRGIRVANDDIWHVQELPARAELWMHSTGLANFRNALQSLYDSVEAQSILLASGEDFA